MDDWSVTKANARGESSLPTVKVDQDPLAKNPNERVAQCDPAVGVRKSSHRGIVKPYASDCRAGKSAEGGATELKSCPPG
jgi:hypothetical protein